VIDTSVQYFCGGYINGDVMILGLCVAVKKCVGIHLQNFVTVPFRMGKYRDGKMSLISFLTN
jgi:hypothetical protein